MTRFVIMTRFGSDIEKFFQSGKKPVPLATVLNIGLQVLNSLEYIHSKGYTHNDVKVAPPLLPILPSNCQDSEPAVLILSYLNLSH